jgi:hypothetical protein
MDYCNRPDPTYNQYRAGPTYNQQLLTSLRESIVDKPPYISGTLQLPDSFFSLFYKSAKGGNAARFEDEVP